MTREIQKSGYNPEYQYFSSALGGGPLPAKINQKYAKMRFKNNIPIFKSFLAAENVYLVFCESFFVNCDKPKRFLLRVSQYFEKRFVDSISNRD